jgi:hypothetical protein
MSINFQEYLIYLKKKERRPIYRISLLRKEDESVYSTIEDYVQNNTGNLNVSLNQGGVRRVCDLNLINTNKRFNSFIEGLSLGNKIKLELGYIINTEEFYLSQGIFLIDSPSIISQLSNKYIQLSCADKAFALTGDAGGILESTITIPATTTVGDAIRALFTLPIVYEPKPLLISPLINNLQIPYTISKKIGDVIIDILKEICFCVSSYVFYDENGYLHVEPFINDYIKGSSYDYSTEEYNYLGGNKKYLFNEIYNSVVVIGENTQLNTPIIFEAINNDLSDINSYPNLGYKKTKLISEYIEGINTQQKAEDRGNWELSLAVRKQSSVDITSIPLFHLNEDDLITLTDDYLNSNKERFIINSFSRTIGTGGEMSINMTKALM